MRRLLISVAALFLAARCVPAAETGPAADERAIRGVVAALEDAWNGHDMKAFAALFAEDADFVNVAGMWWKGRDEIERWHRALHETRMKDSRLATTDTSVRFLKRDVAVAHVSWELTGDIGLDGKPRSPRKGILTQVLAKRDGRWWIVASQNTDVVHVPDVPQGK